MIRPSALRRLRLPLVGALAMAALGAGLAYSLMSWHRDENRLKHQADATRSEIRQRLARAREEEAEIKTKIDRFNELAARGVIGDEHRLDWVETLRAVRENRRLYDLAYELAPQAALDAITAPGSSGSFEFYSSRMRLSLPLLHEGDLINLLVDVKSSASAYVRPRRCVMERTRSNDVNGAELRADCDIDWITIRDRQTG